MAGISLGEMRPQKRLFILREIEDNIIFRFVDILATQRIGGAFSPVFAIAENIDGGIYGLTHRVGVGLPLSGDVEAGAVVWRCAQTEDLQ